MNTPTIVPVILCGGSGTRLWPLSRKSYPKQFVPLIGNKSRLRLSAERLAIVSFRRPPVARCCAWRLKTTSCGSKTPAAGPPRDH